MVEKAKTSDVFILEKPMDNSCSYSPKKLIVSEHPLEILSKRFILQKIQEYKKRFGSGWIKKMGSFELPWYCDRAKFN